MPGAPSRAIGVAAMLTLLTVVAAGCSSAPRPAPSATALPAGINAWIEPEPTSSATTPMVTVVVENGTDQTLTVQDLQVDDPRFLWTAWAVGSEDVTIPAGAKKSIQIGVPTMVCPAADSATTRLTVDFAIGASIAVASLRLEDPKDAIAATNETTCATR